MDVYIKKCTFAEMRKDDDRRSYYKCKLLLQAMENTELMDGVTFLNLWIDVDRIESYLKNEGC